MIEKIIINTFMFLGGFTFVAIVMLAGMSIMDKIERKIKENKVDLNINRINKLICRIRKEGKQIKAKGKYLILEDVLEVELSDKKIR